MLDCPLTTKTKKCFIAVLHLRRWRLFNYGQMFQDSDFDFIVIFKNLNSHLKVKQNSILQLYLF